MRKAAAAKASYLLVYKMMLEFLRIKLVQETVAHDN